jgi:DNA polymerase-3 subunit delta'
MEAQRETHWGVFGHDWAVRQLRQSLLHHRARHAYLITGPASIGKETLARAFAMALNCLQMDEAARPCHECSSCLRILSGNHPDILYSQNDPSTGSLRVDEVRALAGRLALRPYEARYRVAILRDFDRAQPLAQDALLKTLEEPAPHAVLILLAESADRVLPTISSRSQQIALRPVSAEVLARTLIDHFQADVESARLLAGIAGGRIGWAISALGDPAALESRAAALDQLRELLGMNRAGRFDVAEALSKDRPELLNHLRLWQGFWRDVLLANEQTGLPIENADRVDTITTLAARLTPEQVLAALKATRTTLDTLSTTNANPRLALEVMMLDYPGLMR